MKVAQCVIDTDNGLRHGLRHMVCWLDRVDELHPGVQVRLKSSDEPDILWTVRSVGTVAEKDEVAKRRSETWYDTDFVRKRGGWGNASGN